VVVPPGAELEGLEDEGWPVNLGGSARPRGQYPNTRYARGFAVVSCVSNPDGTLRDCAIESEHPRDGQFGRATLSSARRARLQNLDQPGAPVPVTRVLYKTSFLMEGYETREDIERQRESRRLQQEERAARRAASGG